MRAAATYPIHTWRQKGGAENELRYRPTVWTVLRRLAITAVCFLIAGLWEWNHQRGERQLYNPVDYTASPEREAEYQAAREQSVESLREVLDPEAIERILAEADAGRAERDRRAAGATAQYNQVRLALLYVHYGIFGFFVFVGLYPPLSCLWNRVTITRTPQGELAITSFFVWYRTRYWPLEDFYAIRTFAKEEYGFNRRGVVNAHNWVWYVQLSLRGQPQMPLSGAAGLVFGPSSPQFQVYKERHQPSMIGKAPEPVRELVKGLRALTGLKAEPPQLLEGRIVGRKKVAYQATMAEVEATPVTRRQHTFRPGEPIPEDIRAQIAAMTGDRVEEQADGVIHHVQQDIVVTDEQGRSVRYASIEDLPEEVRRRLGL